MKEKRYMDLFGESRYQEKYKKDVRGMKMRYALVLFIFIMAMFLQATGRNNDLIKVREDKSGNMISVTRPQKGSKQVSLDVSIYGSDGEYTAQTERQLLIDPQGAQGNNGTQSVLGQESDEDILQRRIENAARTVNADGGEKTIVLPQVLEDGTRLVWKKKNKNDTPLFVLMLIMALFLMYQTRDQTIKREELLARDSITKELPGFINKIVLLLQGGIVLNEAFDRITSDAKDQGLAKESYFYDQIVTAGNNVRYNNAVMQEELLAFGKRSGVREMMRIANVIHESVGRGADLTDKLTSESRMLWFARKKRAEEKGRLAETKLSLPLMILIIVLIMVTIAPALLEI